MSKWAVYNPKFKQRQYSTGCGWADINNPVERMSIDWKTNPDKAQEWADCLNLTGAGFDHKKAKLPESQVFLVINQDGELYTPPPFIKNPYVMDRVGGKERRAQKA